MMNGRFPALKWNAGALRLLVVAALSALLVLFLLVLGGCSKKQQKTGIEPTVPAVEEPIKVPEENIPVVETKPEPTTMTATELGIKPVFYAFDKFDLSAEARETLNANGRILKGKADVRIIIEGHCDERGTSQYNMALGEKRAKTARDYLADLGVTPSRMEIVSYGKERPFAMGHDESAWAQNRRAHFVIQSAK